MAIDDFADDKKPQPQAAFRLFVDFFAFGRHTARGRGRERAAASSDQS